MLSSKFFQSVLVVLSLSAAAVAQNDKPALYYNVNYASTPQVPKKGVCTSLTDLFHHLGSIQVPSGYKCSLYSGPDCGLGQSVGSFICAVDRSFPDLLTPEVNPCPNTEAFGVGYDVESIYCYRD